MKPVNFIKLYTKDGIVADRALSIAANARVGIDGRT